MSNSKTKATGRPFKPGESGNPAGRPKLPPEIKAAREYTKRDIELCIHRELSKRHAKAGTKLKALMRSIVNHAIKTGDPYRTNFLLENIHGKLPSKVDLQAQFKGELANKSIDELKEMAREILGVK